MKLESAVKIAVHELESYFLSMEERGLLAALDKALTLELLQDALGADNSPRPEGEDNND